MNLALTPPTIQSVSTSSPLAVHTGFRRNHNQKILADYAQKYKIPQCQNNFNIVSKHLNRFNLIGEIFHVKEIFG